jgi:hypothetical protein
MIPDLQFVLGVTGFEPGTCRGFVVAWRERVEELVRREMGAAEQLSVPLEVSVGCGRSWDDAAH